MNKSPYGACNPRVYYCLNTHTYWAVVGHALSILGTVAAVALMAFLVVVVLRRDAQRRGGGHG